MMANFLQNVCKRLQEGEGHQGSKASKVAFLGRLNRLFTTGFSRHSERQYAVWDAVSMCLLKSRSTDVCCCPVIICRVLQLYWQQQQQKTNKT